MIYYQGDNILIRDMAQPDAQIITDEEVAQGWHQTVDKYEARLRDQKEGRAISLVAEYNGAVAGYINVYPESKGGPFDGRGYAEIVDFGVLEKYRRHGIGSRLMDAAEEIAARYSDTVYLAVGLHSGYGSAQRMYVKRGYIPDGSGVWHGSQPAWAYDREYLIDDDLCLWMSKKLR